MSNQKDAILAEMGIKPLWRLRGAAVGAPPASGLPEKQSELSASPRAAPVAGLDGISSSRQSTQASPETMAEEVHSARLTEPSLPRTDWLFVADGASQLSPHAVKLLDAMLAAISLKRGDNVLLADVEQAAELVGQLKPRVIVALGQVAGQSLSGCEQSVEASRGRLFSYQNAPLVISEHPDILLHHPERKAGSWEDLCLAQDQLA